MNQQVSRERQPVGEVAETVKMVGEETADSLRPPLL